MAAASGTLMAGGLVLISYMVLKKADATSSYEGFGRRRGRHACPCCSDNNSLKRLDFGQANVGGRALGGNLHAPGRTR